MKKIALALIIILLTVSCKITEKFVITENQEVDFRFGFDFSPMFKIGKKKKKSEINNKVVDTVLDFKKFLLENKDSVAQLPDSIKSKLEFLSNFNIHMHVDESKEIFMYEMGMKVKSINDIDKDMTPFKGIDALSKVDKNLAMGADKADPNASDSETTYFYDDKMFVKTVKSTSGEEQKKKKLSDNDELGNDDFSKQIKEVLKECAYVMEYTFPKKIKSVSLKGAKISKDKKSFTYEVLFEEMDDNEALGFKVIFE